MFIIDTASISGIYRALSVIGLGVVLLGIGWLYQRLLFPRIPRDRDAAAKPGGMIRVENCAPPRVIL